MSIFSKSKKEEPKKETPKVAPFKVEKEKENLKSKTHGQAYKHLLRPLITEKSALLGSFNQYVFEVSYQANKTEIKKAIHDLYGVKPVKINLIKMPGKSVRYGKSTGKTKNWKKAIVLLKPADKINVYEGV
ncbi:MAG TPA: 50S ribosomal protein L23 [bacterium]|nr:50S ribosomal protein L23 [bacterium]